MRTCARSGCNSPAVATLSYDRIALVAYLVSADDPAARAPGDLCERHTAKLVLPREWHLDDRRAATTAATAEPEPVAATATSAPVKKLRAVKDAAAQPKPARAKKPRTPARPKWTAVEPSLFDATSDTVTALPPARDETDAQEPVWMPRFADDGELEGVLDAKTPLLRRAFGGR